MGDRDMGRDFCGGSLPRGGEGGSLRMGSPLRERMLGEILRLRDRGAGERGRLLAGETELPLLDGLA